MKIKKLKLESLSSARQIFSEKVEKLGKVFSVVLGVKEAYVLQMPDGGYNVGFGSNGIQEDWDKLYPEEEASNNESEKEEETSAEEQARFKSDLFKRIQLLLFFVTIILATNACTFNADILEFIIPSQEFGFIEVDKIEILDADYKVLASFEAETFRAKKIGEGWESVPRSNASRVTSVHCGSDNTKAGNPGSAVTIQYPIKNGLLTTGKYFLRIRASKNSEITNEKMLINLISEDGKSTEIGSSKSTLRTGDWNSYEDVLIPLRVK